MRLTRDDYRIIIEWMEVPENHAVIKMSRKTSKADGSGHGPTKLDGFARLAAYLAKHSTTSKLPRLPPRNMLQRWITYKKKYADAKVLLKVAPEFRLTAREATSGLTLKEKIEKICPHFARMKNLLDGPCDSSEEKLADIDFSAASTESRVGSGTDSDEEEDCEVMEGDEADTSVAAAPAASKIDKSGPVLRNRKTSSRACKKDDDKTDCAESRIQLEQQREFETTQRRLDREDKAQARMHEIVMELARQGKSPGEIQEYVRVISAFPVFSAP